MIDHSKFENAIKLLNEAKCFWLNQTIDLMPRKFVITGDNLADYERFMSACEGIRAELEKFIPDPTADFYNELANCIDNGAIDLPPLAIQKTPPNREVSKSSEKNRRNKWGYTKTSTGYLIDASIANGISLEEMVNLLKKQFGKSEVAAKNRFVRHIEYVQKTRKDVIVTVKDNFYKMEEI